MENDIYEKVCNFILRNWIANKDDLTIETSLLKNLKMDGDDAWEFMKSFGTEFNVDMQSFNFDKHFSQEMYFNPFYYLYCVIFNRKKLRGIPITICNLVKAVKSKKWEL